MKPTDVMVDGGFAVRMKGVQKAYPTQDPAQGAVRGLDLEVATGEFASIQGPSGCGKSTLLNLIAGLDRPDAGEVEVLGVSVPRLRGRALADFRFTHIGFIFQQFHLVPALTVLENILLPLIPRRVDFDKTERARTLLEEVGLAGKRDRLPAQLSGGEQQRVAIARALVAGPRLLLADEPTGNLDTSSGEAVFELLASANQRHGTTVLLITHDEGLATRAPVQVTMRDGRIEEAVRHA